MTDRIYLTWLGSAGGLLLLLAVAGAWALSTGDHVLVVYIMLAAALPFSAVAWFSLRHEAGQERATLSRAVIGILVSAAAMRLLLLPHPPVSTDIFRYVWDGRVQAAGINPYRYMPADSALASLRDGEIFPHINRPATALTIYPPAAQMIFLAVTRISESLTAMKLAMVAFEVAAMAAILALLRRRGLPPTRILLYAWHPLPLFEFSGSGHVDAAAIALMLLACLAADRRRPFVAGALLAAGALVKFFPLVVAPALYRRWDWRAPVAGLLVIAALYAPYLGAGWQVLGYLPGYVEEENLTSGHGFFLLGALGRFVDLPPWAAGAYLVAGLSALAALALAAVFRREGEAGDTAWVLLLLGAFTLVLSPHLAWYFTWIVPLLCLTPAWSLLYVTLAAPLLYGLVGPANETVRNALIYVPFAAILAIELVVRLRDRAPERFSHVDFVKR